MTITSTYQPFTKTLFVNLIIFNLNKRKENALNHLQQQIGDKKIEKSDKDIGRQFKKMVELNEDNKSLREKKK